MNEFEQVIVLDKAAKAASDEMVRLVASIWTLSTKQAADLLGISEYKFRKLKIEPVRFGSSHRRYTFSSIRHWIEDNTEKTNK